MGSVLDATLTARLRQLPAACADDEDSQSTIYARAADLALRMSISAAFKERLTSELGAIIGCSRDGRLTRAGRALAALHVVAYERAESRRETVVLARATIGRATLRWSFTSDEHIATFSLRTDGAERPGLALLRVEAARHGRDATPPHATRVIIHKSALAALDRRHWRSGLDVASLCHALIGFLPEFVDEEWECHEKLVNVLLRNQRRARARAMAAALCKRWWCQKLWWRHRAAGTRRVHRRGVGETERRELAATPR